MVIITAKVPKRRILLVVLLLLAAAVVLALCLGGAAGKDGLGKILVAAAGHAAQEGPEAAVIDLLHRAAQQDLQRPAARVVLVPAPGQMLRPVAGKGADHGGSPPRRVFHSIAKKQPLYNRPPACYDEGEK